MSNWFFFWLQLKTNKLILNCEEVENMFSYYSVLENSQPMGGIFVKCIFVSAGMVVTCPGMKPCSIRVDQLDRDQVSEETINYPVIVHFGIRPPQLSYAGNPE